MYKSTAFVNFDFISANRAQLDVKIYIFFQFILVIVEK
jgi:hypothetical protein